MAGGNGVIVYDNVYMSESQISEVVMTTNEMG